MQNKVGQSLKRKDNVAVKCLIISIFTSGLTTVVINGSAFDIFAYTFFIIYFIFNLRGLLWSKFLWIYLWLIISSLISIALLNLSYPRFVLTIIPIIVIYSCVYTIIYRRANVTELFELYIKFALYTAIFGLIQYFASLVGIDLHNQLKGRINSVAGEPSHYASILLPAVSYTFFHLKKYKIQFSIFLVTLFLTYNLTGYIVFILIIATSYLNPFYYIFSLAIVNYFVFNILPEFSENFRARILDTKSALDNGVDVISMDLNVNGTTLSMFSNIDVTKDVLHQSPILGCGLGGHPDMYFRHFENSPFRYNYYFGLNANAAHSLTIRIFSELGYSGGAIYIFIWLKALFISKFNKNRSVILACLSHFFCKTLKLGSYIDFGTPFFFCLLLYCLFDKPNLKRIWKKGTAQIGAGAPIDRAPQIIAESGPRF